MSSLQIGIVGLPNVGKSTLFNALLKRQAALAANYPFATIEPNVGVVPVPDERLEQLSVVENNAPIIPATVKFVDIAGLVKGASQGEGLGNKFLSHIREVDAIVMVLRDFTDENVVRAGSTDPQADYEVLSAELILADMQTLEKIKADRKDKVRADLANKIYDQLAQGKWVKELTFTDEEKLVVKQMGLLTNKPVLKVLNVDESRLEGEEIRISAKMESDLAGLSSEEQSEYLHSLGLQKSGLEKLIQEAFQLLSLQTFLTAGEKEVRAWVIKKGSTASQAAEVIHTDFAKHFIKADVINWQDFIALGGWIKARDVGKVRQEGRDYVMQEGDLVEFKVGV